MSSATLIDCFQVPAEQIRTTRRSRARGSCSWHGWWGRALRSSSTHPGVTSAIVGPRTMEQLESYLPAADLTLSTDVLDRIDELVASTVTVNPDDNSYGAQELTSAARRR